MVAFETFYYLYHTVTATIRGSGNDQDHLEVEVKHLATEMLEAEEDTLKARKDLEANVNWLAGVWFV